MIETSLKTHPLKGKVIAIDGPAGAGKGTLATFLARVYRLKYLDTGTLYRTVGYLTLKNGGNPSHEADAIASCDLTNYDFKHIGNNQFRVFWKQEDITTQLRTMETGDAASKVAFFTSVRKALHQFQVKYASTWQPVYGVILDGRDIGTSICPDADFKLFLDAAPEKRAKRRMIELEERGISASYEEVLSQIIERDARDRGRKDSPLKPADDALIIDTTKLNTTDVQQAVLDVLKAPPVQTWE